MDQLLIIYSLLVRDWRKWKHKGTVHQLFIDSEKTYDSVSGEIFYIIVTEFDIFMKLVRLIKTCLHEMYSIKSA
jgi:hypothetical protein